MIPCHEQFTAVISARLWHPAPSLESRTRPPPAGGGCLLLPSAGDAPSDGMGWDGMGGCSLPGPRDAPRLGRGCGPGTALGHRGHRRHRAPSARSSHPGCSAFPTREPRHAFSVRKCLVGGVEGGEKCWPTGEQAGQGGAGGSEEAGPEELRCGPAAPGGVRA